ncbi:uncharacterized protein LOC106662638 [Cimex lectularius]|uniref:Superoxide dismutase copper/zinc binding domain-containing protein n=1 Tax=Cimex lectularius TaxID=79782 RepID=A0A8I6RBX7_CIMLE|nr:uncharacterized protein LOC106662638 [Cimex lectularius]
MEITLVGLVLLFLYDSSQSVELTAHLSENGLHGFVTFSEESGNIHIGMKLDTHSSWKWSVRELPIDYSQLENRCQESRLGPVILDLTSMFGELTNISQSISTRNDQVPLTGKSGIWSRSLLLQSSAGQRACATIVASGNSSVKVAEAHFAGENDISGRILIEWFGSSSASDAVFYTDLYHAKKRLATEHDWRIYTTDILESEADKAKADCNSLQVILMELTTRVGKVRVGERMLIRDSDLPHTDIGNPKRIHYIVIMDNIHPETFLNCARIIPKPPTLLKAVIRAHGVTGSISLQQESQLTPTRVFLNVTKVNDPVLGGFRIHTLPAMPPLDNSPKLDKCKDIGDVYNPLEKGLGADAPISAEHSQDNYALGDLSGKLGYAGEREWDVFLPLTGKYSVAHRSLVIYRNGESGIEEPWICVTLTRYKATQPEYKMPVVTAEVTFRYPIVGRIIFQQPDPFGETTILVERLVHADGTSLNTTKEHRWGIHLKPPGKDFFNWTARCVSAGPAFNPTKVNPNVSAESVIGDLTSRLGNLVIAGAKKLQRESRFLFTDDRLPLTGHNSIMGKSVIIFDDHGPKARGDRLACSKVMGVFRRKAVARDWFGNGFMASVSGKIEFYQQTAYGLTDIDINLQGLQDISDFQIHMTPVLEILEFPCQQNTLYEVYNPFNAPSSLQGGTPDQLRVGDLSGKFGTLSGHMSVKEIGFNDTNLMLFGQTSIIGRSLVLYTKTHNKRWACSSIERGYAPSEARELRAIASFHHPLGFAYGYMRMTQLIHIDGSSSDTVIEVNVRHPGKHDRNVTFNHNWAIYVNSIGVDATVKVLNTRCTAAGYIWNPYYTQLADPLNEDLYKQECGSDLPLRCYVGDLSGRLGPINLGTGRKVFTDANFPLEGKTSALGRSIVIFDKDGGHDKYACANIEPDYYTVKYVNVRRPPKFVVSQFLEDVRNVMGIPEWYLTIDSRKTNILYNGACIQLLIHFKGPNANKLEQDFSRLLSTGKLAQPSLYIPGYVTPKSRRSSISYKLCSTSPEERKFQFKSKSSSSTMIKPTLLTVFFVFLLSRF